jgi:heat shock protein HslJ
MNRNIIIITVCIVIFLLIYCISFWGEKKEDQEKNIDVVSNFDECVAQNNPVMESYPRQCRVGDEVFVEDVVVKNDMSDLLSEVNDRLVGKKWIWVRTEMNNDAVIMPEKEDVFSLSFERNGSVQISTDCNAVGGSYTINDHELIFGDFRATMMYCEKSQEQEFMQMIGEVDQYLINDDGELVLLLKFDTGALYFQ